LSFTDRGLSEAAAGATYYYTLSAVDDSADVSVLSAPAAVTVAGSDNIDSRNSNSVTTSVSCFISSAYLDEGFHAVSLLVLIGVFWFLAQGRRNKGASASGGLEAVNDSTPNQNDFIGEGGGASQSAPRPVIPAIVKPESVRLGAGAI
jgi:hypothetical protein